MRTGRYTKCRVKRQPKPMIKTPKVDPGSAMRIGLTGGAAAGKTAVADFFAALNVPIVDTDVIARELVEAGSPALGQIAAAFGAEMLNDDGTLNRRRLRESVFTHDEERRRLESILHPPIRKRAAELACHWQAAYGILVVPLLFETDFHDLVDSTIVVDCSEAQQLERLMQRDDLTKPQAKRMLAAQATRAERLAAADHIIDNSGTLAQTQAAVRDLHVKLLAAATATE